MKKSKTTPVVHKPKKLKSIKRVSKKQLLRRRRPIHKRIMLHPATIFMLLCVGVFLIGWTLRTFAQNITVTASVLAPLPSSAATIIYPADETHFTASTLTLTGTCPSDTYVELYRNGSFSGLANCGPSVTTYEIVTDLSSGSNQLYTRVFNVTDNEGPQSVQITVWRDQPTQVPVSIPSSVPIVLGVSSVDNKFIRVGQILYASLYPTIHGTVPPYSYIVETIHSTIHICSTYADGNGNWSCTLDEMLVEGTHQIDITAKAPSGKVYNYPTFEIYATHNVQPLQKPQISDKGFSINHIYQYQVYASGKVATWDLSINGGQAPYALTIDWGDGNNSTLVRSNADTFQVKHTYSLSKVTANTYTIRVKAVDTNNAVANLQLSALVTIDGARPGSSGANIGNTGIYRSLAKFIKKWVWLIWPVYAVVLLMTTSFWLGEREEHTKLSTKSKRQKTRHKK